MGKLVLFMHTTLNGLVAGPQGEMDWIRISDELFEYSDQQTAQAGTALYGRVTYQMMEAYWPTAAEQPSPSQHDITHSRWYKQVPKVVLSTTLPDSPQPNVRVIRENVAAEIRQLQQATTQDIVIFGSPGAARSLLAANLIDEFWLFVNPVVLPAGIPLFDGSQPELQLQLLEAVTLSNGIQGLHYRRLT
jgi:dihydrofolate reductase